MKPMAINKWAMRKLFVGLIIGMIATACITKKQSTVSKEFVHGNAMYSQSVVVTVKNAKTIYVAGLTGDGVDLEAQTRSTFNNIKAELEISGATFKDIVKTNIYIVNCTPEKVALFRSIRKEYLGDKDMPASTLIGVPTLASTDKLVEIEAIAVIQKSKVK